jgi:hypothetical protein
MGSHHNKEEDHLSKAASQARQIPDLLKAYYSSIEEQAIPDIFLDLLEKLDEAERIAAKPERTPK